MSPRPAPSLADSIAAAQDWWRGAGVDFAYRESPAGWLAEEHPAAPEAAVPVLASSPQPPVPQVPPVGGDRSRWPQDFAAFVQWWMDEPSLDEGGSHPRVAPHGGPGAELLMLVPMPEVGDHETLLAGPQGRLLASFAVAAGVPAGAITLAAALPRHTTLPDWIALEARGHGDVLRHLIAVTAPKRVIVFGRSILPLVGHDPAQAAPAVSELTIQGRAVPMFATYAPERLLENARLRAGLWQRWLEWTDGICD